MNNPADNALDLLRTAIPALADEARARAEELEQLRKIPRDFVSKLQAAGVYRILVSENQGGLGGDLIDWFDMATSLAEADASTGWTCAHGAVTNALVANIADQKFVDSFFSDPNASAAWSNLPRVEVSEEDGGLRISGTWAFATGCTAATYVGGMLRSPKKSTDEKDRLVVALAPIEQATIDETWNPVGLAGTGSHDVVFDDVFVPWQRIFDWPDSTPTYGFPTAVFIPGTWFISICAGATHLGLARRAIDEALDSALSLRIRLAAMTAVHQCTAIVRSVYDDSGASVLSRKGVLQRLYRDASCLTHHISVNRESFEITGRERLGFGP